MKVAVLTVSDRSSAGVREDVSGPVLCELVKEQGWTVDAYRIVPDEIGKIEEALRDLADAMHADVVLTTGGTGFGPRDVTPEATLHVVERETPGFAEVMRAESMKKTPHGMLSRARAGILGSTVIINLPGSPKAVRECFAAIAPALEHAVKMTSGDTDAGHTASDDTDSGRDKGRHG